MADLVIAEEPFTHKLASEMEELIRDFFGKTEAGKNRPPLDYNWASYIAGYEAGSSHIYVAREDGRMVGFGLYACVLHPAHKTVKYAYCLALNVRYDSKGKGIARRIVEHVTPELIKLGCSRMVQSDTYFDGVTPLFEKMPGFKLVERFYQRQIAPDPAPTGSSA